MKPIKIKGNNYGTTAAVWISLKEEDIHEEYYGGDNDEGGYDRSYTKYWREGDTVYRRRQRDARDCDGRFTSDRTWVCKVDGPEDRDGFPMWEEDEMHQRDYSAEAAGY